MPQILFIIVAFIISLLFNTSIFAQSAQQKTQDLTAALAKTKYKKKEKRNISIEIYVDVKFEAVVKNNPRDYAGIYEAEDAEHRLELRVASNGIVEGTGYETDWNSGQRKNYVLRDARIEGALLTASKVFSNGETEKLEAVFSNRTVSGGKNPNQIETRETKYGLGYIRTLGAEMTSRYFLEFKN